jgi:hypothetical protein
MGDLSNRPCASSATGGAPHGWTLVDEVEFQLDYQGSLLKNLMFRSEQEWRCVAYPDAMKRSLEEKFGTHGGLLVPFVEIPLPPRSRRSFWRKARIVLSPEANDELEQRALRRFLDATVSAGVNVDVSRVPVRNVAA